MAILYGFISIQCCIYCKLPVSELFIAYCCNINMDVVEANSLKKNSCESIYILQIKSLRIKYCLQCWINRNLLYLCDVRVMRLFVKDKLNFANFKIQIIDIGNICQSIQVLCRQFYKIRMMFCCYVWRIYYTSEIVNYASFFKSKLSN